MLLLIVLAAFWATENMDEKNPAEFGVWTSPISGVGESGAGVMLDSLLGPILADPDLVLRCAFIPWEEEEEDVPSPAAAGSEITGGSFLSRCRAKGFVLSTGVGGVLTMTGPYLSLLVEGRGCVVSLDGGSIECFSGEAVVLAAAGGSGSCAISLRTSLDALGDELLEDPRRRRRDRREGRRS